MNKELFRKLVGNKFFTVTFEKKDKSLRVMNARLDVKKHLKGGTKSYNDDDFNYITVFDLGKKGYRTVNLDTVTKITAQGLDIFVR